MRDTTTLLPRSYRKLWWYQWAMLSFNFSTVRWSVMRYIKVKLIAWTWTCWSDFSGAVACWVLLANRTFVTIETVIMSEIPLPPIRNQKKKATSKGKPGERGGWHGRSNDSTRPALWSRQGPPSNKISLPPRLSDCHGRYPQCRGCTWVATASSSFLFPWYSTTFTAWSFVQIQLPHRVLHSIQLFKKRIA